MDPGRLTRSGYLRVGHDDEVERAEDGSHLLSRRQVTALAQLCHRPVDLPPGDGPAAGRDRLHGSSALGKFAIDV
jgi:hypothetical protein